MDSLIKMLKKVKDFRKDKGQRHPLWLVLLIIILGMMQGYISYRSLGDFAKFNQESLAQKLPILAKGVPSYSTIRRVMRGVDWDNLRLIFNQWASQVFPEHWPEQGISVDGKSLRSTVENYDNSKQNFIVILSLFGQSSGGVLQISCFENQASSEIHQTQDTISSCSFTEEVFTLDALHCQKETTQTIIESGNDYLVAVKKNQPKLYQALETVSKSESPLSVYQEKEQSHGRKVERKVSVFAPSHELNPNWQKVKSFIKVERSGIRNHTPYQQTAFYISSLTETAQEFGSKIRGHWRIENQLHWVKDVLFSEDNNAFHHSQATINFSILNAIAMNLFRILGFLSITEGQRWLSHRCSRLWVLLE